MLDALLITPPFTQLNTPYPATAYLTGYLRSEGFKTHQVDLSIELFLKVFSSSFLQQMFDAVQGEVAYAEVYEQRDEYIRKVDLVIQFLQHNDAVLAHQINHSSFLPIAHRYNEEMDWEWAFGNMGIIDKAKHKATLFIEELGDFIRENIDGDFAFTRYAESIASAASSFDGIEERLQDGLSMIEEALQKLVQQQLKLSSTRSVLITIPFPGNLIGAIRIAQFVKQFDASIKVEIGGGYVNTELRDLTDPRIFQYIDFITYDDGEGPVKKVLKYIRGEAGVEDLERCRLLEEGEVVWKDKIPNEHILHRDLPTPSYQGINLKRYISFLDVVNPMHRLWSDGRWNKLTIAHGCYWKQCSFCDTSLDYIGNYQQTNVEHLVDQIESMVAETNERGFHFVDEAAPPKVLRAMALELIKRKVSIIWWTNIRFEKTFTAELCELLAASGCIALTGGLEVASDRLLQMMKKGVSIEQVSKVTAAMVDAGIMVHAYLMYGFPTQTEQETMDALELVRQLFENGCLHSAFWHRFSTTAHSPIGLNPAEFNIEVVGPDFGGFAKNDLEHIDPSGADHGLYTDGLNKALYNYMHGLGFDVGVNEWFSFDVRESIVPKNLVASYLD